MLYDNALLARVYLHGWQVMGEERWMRVCTRDPRLGAPRDARARGRLLLRPRRGLRGRGGPLLRLGRGGDARDAGRGGHRRRRGRARPRLLGRERRPATSRAGTSSTSRSARARSSPPSWPTPGPRCTPGATGGSAPASTTSGSCSWNALMIAALADAGAALGRQDYIDAASGCARFVWESMRDSDGRLLRTWKDGEAPPQRLPRGPRLSSSRPCCGSTRRRSRSAGSTRPARRPTR